MKSRYSVYGILVLLFIGTILISGCDQEPRTTGTLVMEITDAPSELNIEKALVTISNVRVHLAEDENVTDENSTTESNWFTVVEKSQTFDLITIKEVKEFLGSAELNAGRYTQIRLEV